MSEANLVSTDVDDSEKVRETGQASPLAARELDRGAAQLVGWVVLAAVNAVFITRLSSPAGWTVRLLHHLYDAGQLVGVGLVSWLAVEAWRRWGSRRRLAGHLVLLIVALGVGAVTVPPDLMGFVSRKSLPQTPVIAAFVTFTALGLVAAELAGRTLARLRVGLLAVPLTAGAAAANNLMLRNDYQGAHLFLAWSAAVFCGAALTGSPIPMAGRINWDSPLFRSGRWLAGALGLGLGAWTLLVWPRSNVVLQLHRLDGAVPVRLLARIHASIGGDDVAEGAAFSPGYLEPWLKPRLSQPAIAPSSPTLAPIDPIIVLLTIDSMRYELLTKEEYRRQLPNLWMLADRSVHFTDTRAPGSSTRNTLGSLFTGKLRAQLNWTRDKGMGVNLSHDPTPRFNDILKEAGAATFMTVAYKPLMKGKGIVEGFEEAVFVKPPKGRRFALAEDMVAKIIGRIRRHREGMLFAFGHLMDAHDPYDRAGTEGTDFERYVREVALCDEVIGKLWRTVDELGLLDRFILVIASDHGDAFGQHETPFHGKTLYEELVRVPLVIRVPGIPPRRVHRAVSLLDLGPTLLDVVGLPTPGHNVGQSLVPYLRGESPPRTHPIAGDTGKIFYLVTDTYKLIRDRGRRTREIYDLTVDPHETNNLYDELGPDGAARIKLLDEFTAAREQENPKREKSDVTIDE